jgi:ParB family chromosome partitioning protein
MAQLPEGKSRLQLVKEMAGTGNVQGGLPARQGRLIVPIDKLIPDQKNERKTFRNMEGLISSVKSVGIIEPITAVPNEDGTFLIRTGHRRWEAAKAAGIEKVEIFLREPENEFLHRTKSLISNIQREDIGAVELAQALQSLMDDDPNIKTQRDLARAIAKDETWVSRILRVLTLPEPLQKKLATSQVFIPYDSTIEAARLDDITVQEEVVNELLKGATVRGIRQIVRQIKMRDRTPRVSVMLGSKEKKVFNTDFGASVIVQSTQGDLSKDQILCALKSALAQAKLFAD